MYAGPIVDSHFHIFQRADTPQYVLLSAAVVQRDFGLPDYRAAMAMARVCGGVVLQAADVGIGMDELAFLERHPADPLIGCYVTYLPIDRADAPDLVAYLAGRHPLVAGVRYSQAFDGHGRIGKRRASIATLRALAQHGLVYEVSVRPWQYSGLIELARAVPDLTIVLGHLGKPRIGGEAQPDWWEGIEALAALPNVWCKVSVALEGPDDGPYRPHIIAPLVRHVVTSFGFDRVVFGTNFPVCLISTTCRGWLELLHAAIKHAGPGDLDKLYRANAVRIYGLSNTPRG